MIKIVINNNNNKNSKNKTIKNYKIIIIIIIIIILPKPISTLKHKNVVKIKETKSKKFCKDLKLFFIVCIVSFLTTTIIIITIIINNYNNHSKVFNATLSIRPPKA